MLFLLSHFAWIILLTNLTSLHAMCYVSLIIRFVTKEENEWFNKTATRLLKEEVSEEMSVYLKQFDKCPLFFDNLYER